MMWSGYNQSTREIVIRRILAKRDNDIYNLQSLNKPIYRTKQERSQVLKEDKATWFRGSGATATLSIPATRDSNLAKLIREVVKRHPGPIGTSVKAVERLGLPITRGLCKNEPFPRSTFGRTDFPLSFTNRGCKEDLLQRGHPLCSLL